MHNAALTKRENVVAEVSSHERAIFIQKTYSHVAFAILAFVILESILLAMPFAEDLAMTMIQSRFHWLACLGAFIVVSAIAEKWAESDVSREQQYMGLALYIIAEVVLFLPLLYLAKEYAPKAIPKAGVATMALFLGLSVIAFTTKTDFSFLGGFLRMAFLMAFGYILAGAFMGFNGGTAFCVIMVGLAGGAILYDTSRVMYHYRTDQYVAASLALFASVALMFWYLLQIFMTEGE